MNAVNYKQEYPLYQKIINQQLNKLSIRYNREDFFQEGMLAIFLANDKYDSARGGERLGFLTICVKWKFQTLLRWEGRHRVSEQRYYQWLKTAYQQTSQTCYWYEVSDPLQRTIIRDLQRGYYKTDLARKLGMSERSLARQIQKIRQLAIRNELYN